MSACGFTVEKRSDGRALDATSRSKTGSGIALPEPVRTALGSIASDLRHLPSEAIFDRAELLFWLRRMANRIDGVAAMTVPATVRDLRTIARPRHRQADLARAATPREVAEAVFGKSAPARNLVRTVTSRKGRTVKVETRRAVAAGQMDLWT